MTTLVKAAKPARRQAELVEAKPVPRKTPARKQSVSAIPDATVIKPSGSRPSEETGPAGGKLAERIAARMEGDIIRGGWKIGTLLGSEAELVARYGASRWVIREAIGILEREGLVTSRRGRNGGVVVTAPAMESVGSAIRQYFNASRVSATDVMDSREVLELLAISLVAKNLDEDSIVRLRAKCQQAQQASPEERPDAALRLLNELFQSTENPALVVFCTVLAQLTLDLALRQHQSLQLLDVALASTLEQRSRQVEALIACDRGQAELSVREHLRNLRAVLASNGQRDGSAPETEATLASKRLYPAADASGRQGARPRLTSLVAAALESQLALENLPEGSQLGSEADLMRRFNVSRTVLREAIRPLERMGIVEMRRGRGSGLFVSKPDPSSIIRSVALFLRFANLDVLACEDIERTIEIAIVSGLAVAPIDKRKAVAARLMEVVEPVPVETWSTLERQGKGFGLTLAEAEPNLVLAFFLRTLIEVLRFRKNALFPAENLPAVARALRQRVWEVAKAIEDGDQALARRHVVAMWQMGRVIAFSEPASRSQP